MFYTYVLKTKKGNELYIGYTSNLKKRFIEHNQGLNFSTKSFRPWEIIYYEACVDKSDAERRENYLKTTQGGRMLKIRIKNYFKQCGKI